MVVVRGKRALKRTSDLEDGESGRKEGDHSTDLWKGESQRWSKKNDPGEAKAEEWLAQMVRSIDRGGASVRQPRRDCNVLELEQNVGSVGWRWLRD